MSNPYLDYKYDKITMPQADAAKYTFSQPPSNIVFYDTSTGNQREVMRITKDGVTSNPDVPTDEGAKAIIRALDAYIKNLTQRTWVGLTDEQKQTAAWSDGSFGSGALWAEKQLKEKNT
jgi:hypothetical protein